LSGANDDGDRISRRSGGGPRLSLEGRFKKMASEESEATSKPLKSAYGLLAEFGAPVISRDGQIRASNVQTIW
jgi:hypothetical protein